uniref:tyrosine-type recombinase/integrase n=1 Tax=Anaerobutyricum hallii TaxID=39488 RepID=UPI003FF123AC
MAAIVLQISQPNIDILHEQFASCKSITGKLRTIVENFLYSKGIYTLDDVDATVKNAYRQYIKGLVGINDQQRKYYQSALDQILLAYLITKNQKLASDVETIIRGRAVRNKVLLYLMEHGIQDCKQIDYDVRSDYKESLKGSGCRKLHEYVKAMDVLKLEAIRKENISNPLKPKALKYSGEKLFLLYHPDYEVAKTFYYIRDKEELLFDFSLEGSEIVKRQIFKMLTYVLEEKKDWHDRRERFLIPLKRLYIFCNENVVEDIELLTAEQIEAFRLSMEGKVGTKTDTYMQIIYNITKYLFITAKNTNWDANIWYLERFSFNNGRVNPAREIERITFNQISDDNRALLKDYMKYQIGIAQRTSLQTIRCQYYDIVIFLKYCDAEKWSLTEVDAERMEKYISSVDAEDIQAESYNHRIISVARLFDYMKSKKLVQREPLQFDYYLKTVHVKHNDRTVSIENQKQVLKKLKHLPLYLRLMFLNLWCEGIRVCELCVIKAGMYRWDGQDAWLKLYQNKMKKEKCIPIPVELYKIMKKYIEDTGIKADEYVFQNKRGGAYDAGTFTKQMKRELKKAGLTEYDFKAHDFRHTIGTSLNKDYNVSIEAIREFLGHNSNDMTKQYIDFVPEMLDSANENYFSKEENKLATYIKKGKRKHDR